ncbi:hypothetical protein D3C75_644870 [compost metagenome]
MSYLEPPGIPSTVRETASVAIRMDECRFMMPVIHKRRGGDRLLIRHYAINDISGVDVRHHERRIPFSVSRLPSATAEYDVLPVAVCRTAVHHRLFTKYPASEVKLAILLSAVAGVIYRLRIKANLRAVNNFDIELEAGADVFYAVTDGVVIRCVNADA